MRNSATIFLCSSSKNLFQKFFYGIDAKNSSSMNPTQRYALYPSPSKLKLTLLLLPSFIHINDFSNQLREIYRFI